LSSFAEAVSFDSSDDFQMWIFASALGLPVQNVLFSKAKNDSVAALSRQASTRPIDLARLFFLSVLMNVFKRNWNPQYE